MPPHPEPIAALLDQESYAEALPLAEAACGAAAAGAARADALEQLGVIHRELGHFARAEAPLLQALSARAAAQGKEHPAYARTMGELGRLYEEQGQYAQAERLFRGALAVARAAGDGPATARALHDLASACDELARFAEADELHREAAGLAHADAAGHARALLADAWARWRRGQPEPAERLVRQAVALLEGAYPNGHPELAAAWQLLTRVLLHAARLGEAERLARRARDSRARAQGRAHPRFAAATEALAMVRAAQGEDDAEALAREALAITTAALGERHPHVAEGLAALAYVQQTRGEHADAERGYEQALAVLTEALGEAHPHRGGMLRDLGEAVAASGRHAEAEEHFRHALALLRPHADHLPVELAETYQSLVRALAAQNRHDDAAEAARQAVALARPRGGDSPLVLATALDGLARVTQAQGRLADAEPLWREMLACRERALGTAHPLYADGLRGLAALLAARGDIAEALSLEEQALTSLRQSLGEHHPDYVGGLTSLANLCAQAGQPDRAEALYAEAVERQRERVGEAHLDHARAVLQFARFYLSLGNAAAAEVRYRQVIALLERIGGDELPEHADALHDLGELCHQVGDLGTAERLLQQAREARQERLGEASPELAQSVLALASVYQAAGRLDDAEPLFSQAVQTFRAALGEDHQATLRARHMEGLFHLARQDTTRAERALLDVRDRLAAAVGPQAPALVQVLMDLARVYGARGDALAAEPLWHDIARIHHAAFPDQPMLHAQDLAGRAVALRALGELAEAEAAVRESLDYLRQARGPDHPDQAAGLGLLAGIVMGQERYDEAEAIYRQALELARAAYGQGHPVVYNLLGEMAGLESARGRLAEAEALLRQAEDSARRAQGEDSLDYLNLQRHRAALYQGLGRLDEAEAIYRQRAAILRRMGGPTSPLMVPGLQLLAELRRQQGHNEEAEALCRQALQAMERARAGQQDAAGPLPGPTVSDPDLGVALAENNLATILLARGAVADAEPLLRRALDGTASSVGDEHPAAAGAMNNLAALYALSGRTEEALKLYDRLVAIDDKLLPQMLALVPERARAVACHSCQDHFETYLALGVSHVCGGGAASGAGALVDRLFAQVLRRKRFGMDVLAAPPWPLWADRYPDHAAALRRLCLLDRQLANKRMGGVGGEGLERHQEVLAAWLRERDEIEARLAGVMPGLERRRQARGADGAAVAAALPPGWALVEVIIFKTIDFSQPFGARDIAAGKRGAAFVLRDGVTTLIDLGDASVVEPAAVAWRRARAEGRGEAEAAAAVRAAFWDRVAAAVGDARGIALAVDGELTLAPWADLPLGDGRRLADRFELAQLICGRDLLARPAAAASGPGLALQTGGAAPAAKAGWWARVVASLAPARAAADQLSGAQAAEKYLHAPAAYGEAATKALVLGQRRPRVLHLDAPGFFLPDPPPAPGPWESPLFRSGLVLAGGERLTSYEITTLDLSGTELVVLPAAAGPAGQPPLWGRLSALVHSFLHAGARNVLVRLWADEGEGPLPALVYRHLAAGESAARAVRLARQEARGERGWALFGAMGPAERPGRHR